MRRRAGRLAVSVDPDHVLRFGFCQQDQPVPVQNPGQQSPVEKALLVRAIVERTLQPQMALQLVSACVRFAGFNENEEPSTSRGAWLQWL